MMAMITKMAKNAPKTSSIFFWPFWGFGSSTGIRSVWHPSPATAPAGYRPPTPAAPAASSARAGAQRTASSSMVRSKTASAHAVRLRVIRSPSASPRTEVLRDWLCGGVGEELTPEMYLDHLGLMEAIRAGDTAAAAAEAASYPVHASRRA